MPRPDRLDVLKEEVGRLRKDFDDFARQHKAPLDVLSERVKEWAWKKKWKIVKWVAGASSAILVGSLSLGYKIWPHIESASSSWVDGRIAGQLKQPGEKLDKLDKDVSAIKVQLDTLNPLINGLLLQRLSNSAALPQRQFEQRLPDIKKLIALAQERGVKADPSLLGRVSQKLLNINPRAPDFWPVSAELVSYRSSNGATSNILQLASAKLPDCTDSLPQPMKVAEVLNEHQIRLSRGLYENCRITLDSAQDNDRLNSYLLNAVPLITFKHCLVLYNGGAVHLILAWKNTVETFRIEGHPPVSVSNFSGNALEFEECLFSFRITSVPPPTGQQLTETLLAQNSTTLKLPHP